MGLNGAILIPLRPSDTIKTTPWKRQVIWSRLGFQLSEKMDAKYVKRPR